MGKVSTSFVLLASAIATCAGCSAQHPAPLHGAATITRSPAAPATTAPGAPAYIGINKNTCVRHYYRAAHIFRVIPPNDYQPLTFSKPRYPILSYCRAGDPGHTVDVSPVEPTLRDVLGITSG